MVLWEQHKQQDSAVCRRSVFGHFLTAEKKKRKKEKEKSFTHSLAHNFFFPFFSVDVGFCGLLILVRNREQRRDEHTKT